MNRGVAVHDILDFAFPVHLIEQPLAVALLIS